MNRPLILASKSPRRKELLAALGLEFTIKTKSINEDFPPDMPAIEVAPYLAKKKAAGCMDFITDNEILITSDSVVILDNVIFGKPKDRTDAFNIISQLSGSMHQVVTGVCLRSKEKEVVFSEVSNVYMNTLTPDEIFHYIDTFQPYDKAGAYGIQDWIGMAKIAKIEGTYTNIMGLPTARLYQELERFEG